MRFHGNLMFHKNGVVETNNSPKRGAMFRLTNLLLGSTVRNLASGSPVNFFVSDMQGVTWEFLPESNIGKREIRDVFWKMSRVVLSYPKQFFSKEQLFESMTIYFGYRK